MQKKTPDYDNVFKIMKSKHKSLFISVINDVFGKCYPMDAEIKALPSEGPQKNNIFWGFFVNRHRSRAMARI